MKCDCEAEARSDIARCAWWAQSSVAVLVVIAIVLVVLIVAVVKLVASSWKPRNALAARTLVFARRQRLVWRQLGVMSKLKQLIGLYQGALYGL
eukprot:1097702-Pleurochrysis_carterae.AAC.12